MDGECCSLWFLKCKGVERRNGGEDWCVGMKTAVVVGQEGNLCDSTSTWGKNPSCVTERGREEGRKSKKEDKRERSE